MKDSYGLEVKDSYGLEVLAFAPHPDDAEMGCGGLLLSMAAQGYRTGIVDLTQGELGSNGTPQIRSEEASEAFFVLGLMMRENLQLPDGWIHPWSRYDGLAEERIQESHLSQVVEVIRRWRPEIVLVPWQESRHPDHQAAYELITKALFFSNVAKFDTQQKYERFAPRQVLYYQMRDRFRPSFIVDISEYSEKKWQAVRCYASQFRASATSTATLINAEKALDAMMARDRYYGAMIGVAHAEAYLCRNTLGIRDPIAHFRHNTYPHAYFFEAES